MIIITLIQFRWNWLNIWWTLHRKQKFELYHKCISAFTWHFWGKRKWQQMLRWLILYICQRLSATRMTNHHMNRNKIRAPFVTFKYLTVFSCIFFFSWLARIFTRFVLQCACNLIGFENEPRYILSTFTVYIWIPLRINVIWESYFVLFYGLV